MGIQLTDRQDRFCQEYIIDLNATQAAVRAGYSSKTAYSMGQRLLKKVEVQKRIQSLIKAREHRTEITQDRVLRELAAVGFARGTDYGEIDGAGRVHIMPTAELTDQQKAALIGMKETQWGVEIKLADKIKALELIGKHLGMFDGGAAKSVDVEDLTPLARMLNADTDSDD